MAKTDEVVSAKMIPVVQGIVDGLKQIFSTPVGERDCEKVRLLTLVLPATIRHGNGLHAGELRQPTKDDDCDNLFNADAGVDREYFSAPGYEGQAAFCRTFHRHFGMSPTRYRRDTPGKESNMQYPLRVGMEIEQERRSAAAAADRDQRMVFGVMTRRAPT